MPIQEEKEFINITGQVEMKEGCWQILENTYEGETSIHSHRLEFEILGNIYKNPELLKSKEK